MEKQALRLILAWSFFAAACGFAAGAEVVMHSVDKLDAERAAAETPWEQMAARNRDLMAQAAEQLNKCTEQLNGNGVTPAGRAAPDSLPKLARRQP